MRCLKCWRDIDGETAVFTKSCQHVFCEPCSENAFKKELACPLCDTVLAKDGIGQIIVRPNNTQIMRMATKLFGLEPDVLCKVMQLGLDFWAKQKRNETVQHVQQVSKLKKELQEAESQINKLSKVLEDERLQKKSVQNEVEAMQRHVSELETRYAEKARSMRKLSELYNELRQVHKRLEVDLRGVRETADSDDGGGVGQSAIAVQTIEHVGRRASSRPVAKSIERGQGRKNKGQSVEESARTSFPSGQIEDNRQRVNMGTSVERRASDEHHSAALQTLFELAPRHESKAFDLIRRRNSVGNERTRRRLGAGELDTRYDEEREARAIAYGSRSGRNVRRG